MNTAELQESIIQKIRLTKDEELLDYLNQLLGDTNEAETYKLSEFEKNMLSESQSDYLAGKTISNEDVISVYKTTEEQKVSILEGHEQIAKGIFFTNEQVEKQIDEWLSKE